MRSCRQQRWRDPASRALSLLLVPALWLACGDDDDVADDGGMRDARAAGDASPGIQRDAASGSAGDAAASLRDGGVVPAEPACQLGGCDLLDLDACGAGEGCVVAFPEAADEAPQAVCMQVGGAAEGASCSSERDCAPGLHCAVRNGAAQCLRYCCEPGRQGSCPAGQFCGLEIEDARGTPVDVFLCDGCNDCDVRDRGACARGFGCYLLPELGACRVCLPAGTAQPGEPCTLSTDCRPGAACVQAPGGERACLEFCDLAAPACPGDDRCLAPDGAELPPDTGLCL